MQVLFARGSGTAWPQALEHRQAQVGQTDGMFMPRPLARVRLPRGLRAQIARSLERRLRRRKPSNRHTKGNGWEAKFRSPDLEG